MDRKFEWRVEYELGGGVIDREHLRPFKIIYKLFRLRVEEE